LISEVRRTAIRMMKRFLVRIFTCTEKDSAINGHVRSRLTDSQGLKTFGERLRTSCSIVTSRNGHNL
jgi:hypothetical protein